MIPDNFIDHYFTTMNAVEDPTQQPTEMLELIQSIQGDEDAHETMNAISARLPESTSALGAAWHAVLLGASVEGGRDPLKTVKPVVETLLKWNRTLPDEPEDENELIEIDASTSEAIGMLGQATVAHLSRISNFEEVIDVPAARAELERTEYLANGPMWVMQVFRQQSGSLVVLHATQAFGAEVAFEHLANNFHLFTLLQGALAEVGAPGAKKPKARVIEAAKNGCKAGDAVRDEAWWHYSQHDGQPDQIEPSLAGMVFGEGELTEIGTVDGQPVLLLWPPVLKSRGWGGGFFSPLLEARPPNLQVTRVFDGAEVMRWRSKLGLGEPEPPDAGKSRWKFW